MLSYASQPHGVTRSRLKRKCEETTQRLRSEMTQADIAEAIARINAERPDDVKGAHERMEAEVMAFIADVFPKDDAA